MRKYEKLWDYLKNNCITTETLTFDEIRRISGSDVDDSFIQYSKDLSMYGLSVVRVDLRSRTVMFTRNGR